MKTLALASDESSETPLQSAMLKLSFLFADVQHLGQRERTVFASIAHRALWQAFGDALVVEEAEEITRRAQP
jgi:hypothetical protein